MALRFNSEEEFREWQRQRGAGAKGRGAVMPGRGAAARAGQNVTPAQRTAAAGLAEVIPKRKKYGNVPTEVDGIRFDSKHEAEVYQTLMARVKAGELRTVCRQVKFDLTGGIVYVADFVAIRPDMSVEAVYDAKSEATKKNRVYIMKKKLMKACWNIEIVEV